MPLDKNDIPYSVTEARTRLIAKCVFFSVILYEQCDLVLLADSDDHWKGMSVDTACTDGRHIVINVDFFENKLQNIDERIFVLAHEVFHAMVMHPRRMAYYQVHGLFGYEFNAALYNVAADAVINKCLLDDGIGQMPPFVVYFPNPIEHEDGRQYQITGRESPEDVYEYLMRTPKCSGGGNVGDGGGDGGGAGGSGQDAIDGQGGKGQAEGDLVEADTQTASKISESEMKASMQSAANQAKSRGQLPGNLKSMVDDFLEPEVNWEEQLRSVVVRCANPDSYSWNKPNRRMLMRGMYTPRRVGTHCGHVVCAIDTSGSVSDLELSAFLGEMSAILSDVNPTKMTIIWCDSQVDRVDEVDDPEELRNLVRAEGVMGRGGTKFSPPFEYAAANIDDPAFFIYLTDMYAPFEGTENVVDCPVIWVASSDVVAPHGITIPIDVSGRAR